jgi:hypothetical protein
MSRCDHGDSCFDDLGPRRDRRFESVDGPSAAATFPIKFGNEWIYVLPPCALSGKHSAVVIQEPLKESDFPHISGRGAERVPVLPHLPRIASFMMILEYFEMLRGWWQKYLSTRSMSMTSFYFLSCFLIVASGAAATDTLNATPDNRTLAITSSLLAYNATRTIAFSSAVQLASSVQWQLEQVATTPAIPIPTNITAIPEYQAVSRLAPGLPIVQAGVEFPSAESMISDLISWSNVSSTKDSIAGRQSSLRVMIVGDSLSQGKQGDYTWRYRIWQWFQENNIAVDFVGPYWGTVPPATASVPQPPPLYGTTTTSPMAGIAGGYARDVDSAFLSNCNHFAVWGRAAAVDKGLIEGVLQQNPADMMLLMLGFNDMGWFYSDAPGTIDSIETLVSNARAVNPNLKFAIANVPQRSFIIGRQDLVDNTVTYNGLLPGAISKLTTEQSPIYLVDLEENYDCQPGGCPAGMIVYFSLCRKTNDNEVNCPTYQVQNLEIASFISNEVNVLQATTAYTPMPGASTR